MTSNLTITDSLRQPPTKPEKKKKHTMLISNGTGTENPEIYETSRKKPADNMSWTKPRPVLIVTENKEIL